MSERWCDVNGYEGMYMVSDHGRVKTISRLTTGKHIRLIPEKIMNTPIYNLASYMRVALYKNGKCKQMSVHRLVALHFVEGYKEGLIINHKDCDKSNNHFENLEWCTHSHNNYHAYQNNRVPKVMNMRNFKHSIDVIEKVNKLISFGLRNYEIRDALNLPFSTVSEIRHKKLKRHVRGV